MFLEFYGLIEQPFGVTVDPRFLYLGAMHREAMASLLYGTETNRAFLALIAKPGMGKTSLLVQYRQRYEKRARICHLFQTDCDAREFLRQILSNLGTDAEGKDLPGMRDSLNQVLIQEMEAGRRFVLVIDEAQNLDDKVLESVRLLSNFETPTRKLMQIVLAGQPQLAERLAKPSMRQFRQRISIVVRLEPFTPGETNVYIDHRLRVAGYKGPSLFTDRARLLIAEHCEGIPRNINNLCFNAMSLGCAMGAKQIDSKIVREVISDLEIESLAPRTIPAGRFLASTRVSMPVRPTVSVPMPPSRRGIGNLSRPLRPLPVITAFVVLVLLGVASGVSWNRGVGTPQLTERVAVHTSGDVLRNNNLQKHDPKTDGIQTIVVEKNTTLRQLSLKSLGRFDPTTLAEILKVNPEIKDPNRIRTGQTLQLPLNLKSKRIDEEESGGNCAGCLKRPATANRTLADSQEQR